MQKFFNLVISGTVTGAIYSIMASGLVLTYQTSGIFNFAHAAVAFTTAYFYYQLNSGQDLPAWLSLILSVLVFAPLLGLALDRMLLRRLSTAPAYARIVGTIGLLVALPALSLWLVEAVFSKALGLSVATLEGTGVEGGFVVPGITSNPPAVYRPSLLGVRINLNSDQLAVFVVAAVAAVVLYVIIRRTRVGLEMRALVDRDTLAALRGVDPVRTSQVAWVLTMVLAGVGGILIAPLFNLADSTFLFVVLGSLAAVAVAGFRSIPLAFLAGLGLGVVQNLVYGYADDVLPKFLNQLTGLRPAIPFLLTFVVLCYVGRSRGRVAGTMAEEKPAPDHRAGLPAWRRRLPWVLVTLALVVFVQGWLGAGWAKADTFEIGLFATGLAYAIVFLSFVVVTGIGGMVSLMQASFVTAGGFMAGWALMWDWGIDIPFIAPNHHTNFMVAALMGAVVAAGLGALIALPIRRLNAVAIAVGTFAAAFALDFVIFQNKNLDLGPLGTFDIPHGTFGYSFRYPTWNVLGIHTFDFADPKQLVMGELVLFGIVALLVYNLQRSATGRAMYAVRSSEVAARTSGIAPTRTYVLLFALAGGIAGFGGAILGVANLTFTATSTPPVLGLIWVAVVVTFGVRRAGGALLAGLAFSAAGTVYLWMAHWSFMPTAISDLLTSSYFTPMLFGLGAINLAKNPDGLLALIGHQKLEKRRAKEREARMAAAEAELHEGEPVAMSASIGEDTVLEVVHAATPADAALALEGVVAGYGDVEVLHGVSVAVRSGQVVAMLGANGAGKSTLCAVAAGIVPPTMGKVWLAGREVTSWVPHERARAGLLLIPEARGIFPGLSVEENLQVLLRDPHDRDRAYERFPILGERRKQIAGLLSGGEQQMLSLAPALANPPRALVADEPTLGLAPLAAEVVIGALRELRERGTAILLVEEKAREVMELADVVAFMELGRLVWMGPREEADEEVLAAAYLGSGRA